MPEENEVLNENMNDSIKEDNNSETSDTKENNNSSSNESNTEEKKDTSTGDSDVETEGPHALGAYKKAGSGKEAFARQIGKGNYYDDKIKKAEEAAENTRGQADLAAQKVKENKERRKNERNNPNNKQGNENKPLTDENEKKDTGSSSGDSSDDKDKKNSDKEDKKNAKSLKGAADAAEKDLKNLKRDKRKARQFAITHPVEAAKLIAKFVIKKILCIVLPPLFFLFVAAFLVLVCIYAIFGSNGVKEGAFAAEFYNLTCLGNVKKTLIDALEKPVETRGTINFFGQYDFGAYNGVVHNGLDLNTYTTANKAGDEVYSLYDDGKVIASTVDNTYPDKDVKGGWVQIEYDISLPDGNYNFVAVYGGLAIDSLTLKKDDKVSKKQVIGKIGSPAESEYDISSLHFGMYNSSDKQYLDPRNMFIECTSYSGSGLYQTGYENADVVVNAIMASSNVEERIKDNIHLAGILGNLSYECGLFELNPKAIESSSETLETVSITYGSHHAIGIAQWDGGKDYPKDWLLTYAREQGKNWYDINLQAEFLALQICDYGTGYCGMMNRDFYGVNFANYEGFASATTVDRATEAFTYAFEGCGGCNVPVRKEYANRWYDILQNAKITSSSNIGGATNVAVGLTTGILQSPYDTDGSTTLISSSADQLGTSNNGTCGSSKTVFRSSCEYHGGNDYPAATGTPVYAVDGGVVAHAGSPDSGWEAMGIFVSLENSYNGKTYTTTYQHLSSVTVQEGQEVKKGELLGYVGCTGSCEGPHLHLEIIKGDLNCKSSSSSCRSSEFRINPYDYIVGSKKGQNYFSE